MYKMVLFTALTLAGCAQDETLVAYGAADQTWVLQSLNGAPFPAQAGIAFQDKGTVRGAGPCNGFSARQTAPYPWIALEQIALTKRACRDLPLEHEYFSALRSASLVEVVGETLILSNDSGLEMIFVAAPSDP